MELVQEQIKNVQSFIDSAIESFAKQDFESVLVNLKELRNVCALGEHMQETIAKHHDFNELLKKIIEDKQDSTLQVVALQVMANTVVGNNMTQRLVWEKHGEWVVSMAKQPPMGKKTDILLMVIYNIYQGGASDIPDELVYETCVKIWKTIVAEKCDYNFVFLHFFFEDFLVEKSSDTVQCYSELDVEDRLAFLNYLITYLDNGSPNGRVNNTILFLIATDFKMQSDDILSASSDELDKLHAREVHTMLRILAKVSGSVEYDDVYEYDRALFLNVSSLLRCLVEAGKSTDGGGLPKPMTKLEEVALNSDISTEFEKDVSFELKTLLVRCTANLLYKNEINKRYCVETNLMPTLLECTTMDARNPLLREWSILAIRNACVGCPEVQEIIANLTMQVPAKNDIINELNLELGSLRISSQKV